VHKVRVSPEEEGQLVLLAARAGGVSIPRLLVERALSSDGVTAAERRSVVVELFALRRVLSGVASDVNGLARRGPDGFPVEEARELLRRTYELAVGIDDAIDRLAAAGVRG
jgi:hypothetical protein